MQVGGGAKRFPSVAGGHTDVAIFAVSEFIQWKDAGLKPLVIFSEERVPELPDVPTAKEMGIDLVANGMRIWIAPKGIPDEARTKLTALLKRAVESPEGQAGLRRRGLPPGVHRPGRDGGDPRSAGTPTPGRWSTTAKQLQ